MKKEEVGMLLKKYGLNIPNEERPPGTTNEDLAQKISKIDELRDWLKYLPDVGNPASRLSSLAMTIALKNLR